MGRDILAIDVGTSGLKLGVYGADLVPRISASRSYDINIYEGGKADVQPETLWTAITSA
jgi:sugar (pentulose or hexulose) kinase